MNLGTGQSLLRSLTAALFLNKKKKKENMHFCDVAQLGLVTRKLEFCLCENKGADQLSSNCTADQRLCFRYTNSTIPLLKSEISSS